MNRLQEILNHNETFVGNKDYEEFVTSRYPDKKMVILTCMDTRLVELLPKAMNLRNGDAKIIKNAGAIVTHPFGNILRSILVALYELDAQEVFVVGHHQCGMTGLNADNVMTKMRSNGIQEETFTTLKNAGIHLENWLKGFNNVEEGVRTSVKIISNHPLLPANVPVHGLIIDPTTGQLELVVDGYAALAEK
jgi:carbonic anhydrase